MRIAVTLLLIVAGCSEGSSTGTPEERPATGQTSKAAEEGNEQWTAADSSGESGSVRVSISSSAAAVDKKPNGAKAARVVVEVETTNLTETKKMDFHGWDDDHVTVADEFGNEYVVVSYAPPEFPASIYPGKSRTDSMTFEAPVSEAHEIRMTFDTSAVGDPGEIRVKIPPPEGLRDLVME